MCFFFFSSRRRHTRLVSDWSSDVCSSDLIPPDYHHIHWFSLQSFRSIICCAAVDQNRLSKSSASEEKREFHFPYDTCLCKASLTTHTLSGLQFSLINLTSWQHRARVSRIKSQRQFVLVWAQTCKLQSGAKRSAVMGLSRHSHWVTVGKYPPNN